MELDVVVTADPVRALQAIKAAGAGPNGPSPEKPEPVRFREKLRSGLRCRWRPRRAAAAERARRCAVVDGRAMTVA